MSTFGACRSSTLHTYIMYLSSALKGIERKIPQLRPVSDVLYSTELTYTLSMQLFQSLNITFLGWTPQLATVIQPKYIYVNKMEALLEKIVQNTEPKSSLQIIVSNNKTRFKTRFNPPIQLDKTKQYEIALVNLETYYSCPNIDASNIHFSYSPDDGDTWFEMCIPEGSYDITDINDTIKQNMRQNGHYDPRMKNTTLLFLQIQTLSNQCSS